MLNTNIINKNPKLLSPLTLAFLGDAVFEVLVREDIVLQNGSMPPNSLHKQSVTLVNAASQAKAVKFILQNLNQDELQIYKRGRNADSATVPKHCSAADYHSATGLECLFGYLYLLGENKRLNELFTLIKGADQHAKN